MLKLERFSRSALSLDARNDVNRDGSGLEPEATRRDPWPEMTRVSNYFAAGARRVAICIFRQYFEPSNTSVVTFFSFVLLLCPSNNFIQVSLPVAFTCWNSRDISLTFEDFFFSLKKLLIRLIKKLVL